MKSHHHQLLHLPTRMLLLLEVSTEEVIKAPTTVTALEVDTAETLVMAIVAITVETCMDPIAVEVDLNSVAPVTAAHSGA